MRIDSLAISSYFLLILDLLFFFHFPLDELPVGRGLFEGNSAGLLGDLDSGGLHSREYLSGLSNVADRDNLVEKAGEGAGLRGGVLLVVIVDSLDLLRVRTIDSAGGLIVTLDNRVDVVPRQVLIADERADKLVLAEELTEIDDEIACNGEVRERPNEGVGGGEGHASERVRTVNIHSAATTDALTAGRAEGESGVVVGLNSNQEIENHKILLLVELVAVDTIGVGVGVPADHLKERHGALGSGLSAGSADDLRLVGGYDATDGHSWRCESTTEIISIISVVEL